MKLIGRNRLQQVQNLGPDGERWVAAWVSEVRNAHWKRPADVGLQFPSVALEPDGSYVFPVRRHSIGVQVIVVFGQGVALIVAVRTLVVANAN